MWQLGVKPEPLPPPLGRTIHIGREDIERAWAETHRVQRLDDRDPPNYLVQRYGIDGKPEGWNDAVLHAFHAGPELREKGGAFHDAFAERVASGPQTAEERIQRTQDWAARFREAAAAVAKSGPAPNVHPTIHAAQVQSFISEAERLEEEAMTETFRLRRLRDASRQQ